MIKQPRSLSINSLKTVSGAFLFALGVALLPAASYALESLDDTDMSDVTGAGLAFALDDFSFRMAPTSYIELIGSAPTAAAAGVGWKRGDVRYYGLSITNGETPGTDWYGNGCNTGAGESRALACPIGTANGFGVRGFASVFNPFLARVFQYDGLNFQGTQTTSGGAGATLAPTVFEVIGPSQMDPFRMAFWGLMEVGRGTPFATGACVAGGNGNTAYCGLQSQTILLGKLVASGRTVGYTNGAANDTYSAFTPGVATPTIVRLLQTDYDADNDARATLGLNLQLAFSGDMRFSVRQNAAAPATGTPAAYRVPDFNDSEGIFIRNMEAFLPLGALHYQALVFGGVSNFDVNGNLVATFDGNGNENGGAQQNGNFTIELTRIAGNANDINFNAAIYNQFYCGSDGGARSGATACSQDANGYIANPNPQTRGYIRLGNWVNPTNALGPGPNDNPTANSTANGMYFANGAGGVTNVGTARIEGLLLHNLKITTLGAL